MNRKLLSRAAASVLVLLLLAGTGSSSQRRSRSGMDEDLAGTDFHMARVVYRTFGGAGSRGFVQPWWAIDYPYAEEHFFDALRRFTNMTVAEDSAHLELSDDRIFQHPFLFLQQPAQGGWNPDKKETENLREYFARGGFMLVDDFHGEYEWAYFQQTMRRILPDRPIVDIPESDPVMHAFFDLVPGTPIPGERHLRMSRGGEVVAQTEGPPRWRGIYDDKGRLIVAMNFNMDMGDAWEHADDPYYPAPMTINAYQLGVNYVIYAMTH